MELHAIAVAVAMDNDAGLMFQHLSDIFCACRLNLIPRDERGDNRRILEALCCLRRRDDDRLDFNGSIGAACPSLSRGCNPYEQ